MFVQAPPGKQRPRIRTPIRRNVGMRDDVFGIDPGITRQYVP